MSFFTTEFAFSVLRVTTPILFAALGALISNRAGIINIGLEGIMLVAALSGVVVSAYTGSSWVGLMGAVMAGTLISGILAFSPALQNAYYSRRGSDQYVCLRGNRIYFVFAQR